ncbi:MAG: M23 family metallopeptidase, partial [Rhizobium sp.]|nr:M23 family metallopeptidase [Rhizobium sp.]
LVKVGDDVATGDIIGLAGSTGRSTGPHLHYEIRRNGDAIDPMQFLNAGMKLTPLIN